MILDALTLLSDNQDITGSAAAIVSTNTLDLSVLRDIGASEEPVVVAFTALPLGPAGATLNIAIQTSLDNVTWTTVEESSPQLISNYTPATLFGFRSDLPVGIQRYIRIVYTASAALTAGSVTACIGADYPTNRTYARNYVA